MMKPGIRVVRGPDWSSGKQDSGEGFLGTVVYVPKSGSDDKSVTVIWDTGREVRYKAGLNGKYDLRVFDNAQIGIQHLGINCNICKEKGICGMRWVCCNCKDTNLCSSCYMADKHDLNHPFERYDTPKAKAVNVPLRSRTNKSKPTARGLFPGAEVMRGPHWKWRNDDGGDSNAGTIIELSTWESKSFRGAVKVLWNDGPDRFVKHYRVGAEGCVDVIFGRMIENSNGGTYYADHLPLVNVVESETVVLKAGDKVTVNIPFDKFKKQQEESNTGGWLDEMNKCLTETGTIIGFLNNGQAVRTQYEDDSSFLINRNSVYRVHTFVVGEPIKVLNDYEKVKRLQRGHGGWNDEMKPCIGKAGNIIRIDGDGDMRVKVDNKTWIFNPTCLQPTTGEIMSKSGLQNVAFDSSSDETDDSDWSFDESYSEVSRNIADLFTARKKTPIPTEDDIGMLLVNAAADNDLEAIKNIVHLHQSMIDAKYEQKTALQVACFEGYYDIAEFLVKNGADVNKQNDKDGEAPIHFAVTGKETKIIQLLVENKINVNLTNAKRQTALHIAVKNLNGVACKIFINKGADPSLKDNSGATAMHYVIENRKCPKGLLAVVLESKLAKFETENKEGHNILHFAIIKKNKRAVEVILKKNKRCIDLKKKDGRTALHLSAETDCLEISNILISEGADKNAKNKDEKTPLLLAVNRGHIKTVDLLIQFGCDINSQDSSGNTALHIIQINASAKVTTNRKGKRRDDTQILCKLIEMGANIEIKNKKGKTVIDLCVSERDRIFIKTLAEKVNKKELPTSESGIVFPSYWAPMTETIVVVQLKSIEDAEFKEVRFLFTKTMPQATVKSVSRVQNKLNWEIYQLKKKGMEKLYGIGCSNELTLFHGTQSDKVDLIINQGLDFRLSGNRTGTLFGKGAYFALEAKYSDNYAVSDSDGLKVMLVFDVLAGKYCVGSSSFTRPPNDPDNPERLLDSCVNDMKKPTIYCLFDNHQYYLKYLIKYS